MATKKTKTGKKPPSRVLSGKDFKKHPINPRGRPSLYSEKLVSKIMARISRGESVCSITKDKDMPGHQTFWLWMGRYPEFAEKYTRAREQACEAIADEMFGIADDGQNDYMEKVLNNGDTVEVVNQEHIQRSRLRIDQRKWFLSKIAPKKYGDKVEHTNINKYEDMTDEEIDARIAQLEQSRKNRIS